jgi:hypothetical protein
VPEVWALTQGAVPWWSAGWAVSTDEASERLREESLEAEWVDDVFMDGRDFDGTGHLEDSGYEED